MNDGELIAVQAEHAPSLHTCGATLDRLAVEYVRGRLDRREIVNGSARNLLTTLRQFAASFGRRLGDALSKVAGANVTAHQLRHYFGTEAARWSGGNLLLVGKLMGHGSPSTTQGYCAFADGEGHDVVSKISAPELRDDLAARRSTRTA